VACKGEAWRATLARLAGWASQPGAIFLLAVPLAAMKLLPEIGGKNPFFYGLLFVYGYIYMSGPAWQRATDGQRRTALALAAVTSAGLMAIWGSRPPWASHWPGDLFVGFLETLNGW